MQATLQLLELSGVFDVRSAFIPVAGATVAGISFLLFRGKLANIRPFGVSNSESIMNFSSLGTLRCVCGAEHQEGAAADRRSFCRSCGCEVVAPNRSMLQKQLTSREIKHLTRSLRQAAIRASHLQLPPSITTVEELHRYLDTNHAIPSRNMPPPPSSVGQPQVH